jgi:predicted membrane channel-forming protein YqfA (hemolysin III family)
MTPSVDSHGGRLRLPRPIYRAIVAVVWFLALSRVVAEIHFPSDLRVVLTLVSITGAWMTIMGMRLINQTRTWIAICLGNIGVLCLVPAMLATW